MDLDTLNRMRSEGRRQQLMLLISLTIGALVMLALYFYAQNARTPAAAEEPLAQAVARETLTPVEQQASVDEAAEDVYGASGEIADSPIEQISIEPGTEPGDDAVAGIALRKGHNTPLRSLRLQLVDESGEIAATTRTDRDGMFRFADVAPGKYYLETMSENFSHRKRPLMVGDGNLEKIRFEVLPSPPSVGFPRYSRFKPGVELPAIEATVFRFGSVDYSLYRIELAQSFINVVALDDLLAADVSGLEPVSRLERSYTYSVSFSEQSDEIDFDVTNPGLYLLEAKAGRESFRGLVSISSLELVSKLNGGTLEVVVLGLGGGNPEAVVKVNQGGVLLGEGSTNAAGIFSVALERRGLFEVLVSDGSSFAWAQAESRPQTLAAQQKP